MTSLKQISLFTEDQLTSSLEVSHVNPIRRQESGSERQTNAIYGRACYEQFAKFVPDGSWAKTFSGLLIGQTGWYSRRCALRWKLKGTKYNRLYFQLQPSTPRTEEIGSGLLLTPGTMEIAETPEKYQERQRKRTEEGRNQAPHPGNKYNCLTSQVLYSGMLLKTPSAMDAYEENLTKKEQEFGNSGTLAQEIQSGFVEKRWPGLLPTPRVKGHGNSNQRIADGKIDDLTTMVRFNMLPTPSASDFYPRGNQPGWKGIDLVSTIHKTTEQTGKTSQLSPQFVMEMMGFPTDWTELPFQSGETRASRGEEMQ